MPVRLVLVVSVTLAIAYGFNRYNHDVTILATIIIILIIFAIQFLGDFLTKKLSHK